MSDRVWIERGYSLKNFKKTKELLKIKNKTLKTPTAFDLKISLAKE
jgi:hypothetical protein